MSDQWKPDSLAEGYRAKYTANATFNLAAPSLTREALFSDYANNDASRITYSMSFAGVGGAPKSPESPESESPGKFLVGSTGEAIAIPSREGRYTGRLEATDGGGAIVVVKQWEFVVRKADVLIGAYGPGGTACANGVAEDAVLLDGRYTCDCAGTYYTGANCELKQTTITGVRFPMALADGWNASSLGADEGYKTRYTLDEAFGLAAPGSASGQGPGELFVNYSNNDKAAITFSMARVASRSITPHGG